MLVKVWHTRACEPATRPTCAGLVRGVVSHERRAHFSGVAELAGVMAARGGAQDPSAVLLPAPVESREDLDDHAG